jgi:hypothetical protein
MRCTASSASGMWPTYMHAVIGVSLMCASFLARYACTQLAAAAVASLRTQLQLVVHAHAMLAVCMFWPKGC